MSFSSFDFIQLAILGFLIVVCKLYSDLSLNEA